MRTHKEMLHEDLKEPREAKAYLQVALAEFDKDRNIEALLMSIEDVIKGLAKYGR